VDVQQSVRAMSAGSPSAIDVLRDKRGFDLGFMAYAYLWIDKGTNGNAKSQLTVLFNNYVPRTIEAIHRQIKHIVPLPDVVMVMTLCRLLRGC
jgi:hypothetical protein